MDDDGDDDIDVVHNVSTSVEWLVLFISVFSVYNTA